MYVDFKRRALLHVADRKWVTRYNVKHHHRISWAKGFGLEIFCFYMEGIKHTTSNHYVQCQFYAFWLVKVHNLLNQEQWTNKPRKGTTCTLSSTGPFQSDTGQIHVNNDIPLKKGLKFFHLLPTPPSSPHIFNSWWMDALFGDDPCEVVLTQRYKDMNSCLLPIYICHFSLLDPCHFNFV